MKFLFAVPFVLIFSISVHASVLSELRESPATQYDIGKLQLEIYALMLSKEFENKSIEGTDFKWFKFRIKENKNKTQLGFVVSLKSNVINVSKKKCQDLAGRIKSFVSADELAKRIWPDLNDSQYDSLSNEFVIITELVSQENTSLAVRCFN